MRITDHIRLVGSGQIGLSNPMDCHVYLIGGPGAWMLVDAGVGLDTERIIENIARHCVAPEEIQGILLTHAHADHAGGARQLKEVFGCPVYASPAEAELVESGDDDRLGLERARRGGVYPADYRFPHCPVDSRLQDGGTLDLATRA